MFMVRAMGLGSKIRELRQAKGWTLEQLEEASGVASGTIHAIEARDSSRSQYFPALAKAFETSVEELQSLSTKELSEIIHGRRTGDIAAAVMARAVREEIGRIGGVNDPGVAYGLEPILAWEHPDDLPAGEFVMVPRLDVHLSAGGGRQQVEIDLVKENPQAFRSEWIRLMHLKPNKLAAMRAAGDSMEPTIHDGDSLLIDTSQVTVADGKVYALWYEGGERVKRLYRLPGGGLRIKSDNQAYETIDLGSEYAGHVRIIGRVVHRSGTGGL